MDDHSTTARPKPSGKSAGQQVAAAPSSGRWDWKSLVLWGAVLLVCGAIILIIVLCARGRKGDDTKTDPSEDLQITTISKRPKSDARRYQYTTLENGLKVVNIQDSTSVSSAFAMAVTVGSFDDPVELPGLAHFCEHMLFLGTTKYPDPFAYDEFVSSNGGQLNAFTGEEVTVYFTEIVSSAAGEGLKRFSDFFRAPLFYKQYVEREVHAIDNEHAKNVHDPAWRTWAVMHSLAQPGSPVGAFHTGNKDTLYDIPRERGIDTDAALRTFYRENYCPSRFRLVTFGPESLENQLERAYEDFSDISEGTCNDRRSWKTPAAWEGNSTGLWATIEGSQPQAELIVFFSLPDLTKDYKSQPLEYISYAITYGGENSLATTLRDTLGLVQSVNISTETSSAGTSLWLSYRLARHGRENPELVLDLLFQYLHMLQGRGVDETLYKSLINVSKLSWDWAQAKEPTDTVSSLAEKMTRLPTDRLLSGDEVIEYEDTKLVVDLLNRLSPYTVNVGFVDPDAEIHLFPGQEVHEKAYYGTRYTLARIEEKLPGALGRWSGWKVLNETEVARAVAVRLAASGVPYTSDPVPVPPGPIQDVATNFSLKHMRVKQEGDDTDWDVKLYGPRPDRLEVILDALEDELFKLPHVARRVRHKRLNPPEVEPPEIEPPKTKEPKRKKRTASYFEVWHREGWVSHSPMAQMEFWLRPRHDEDEDVEGNALSSLRLSFYASILSEELGPKLYDHTANGASFNVGLSSIGGKSVISFAFTGFPQQLPSLLRDVVKAFSSGVNITDHMPRFDRLWRTFNDSFRDYSSMPLDLAVMDRNLLLTAGLHSQEESLDALEKITTESVDSVPGELIYSSPLDLTGLVMGNLGLHEAEEAVQVVMEGIAGVQSIGATIGRVRYLPPVVRLARPVELRKKNPREGDANDAVVVSLVAGVATVESHVILGLLGRILSPLAFKYLRTTMQFGYVVKAGMFQISNVQYISTIVQGKGVSADTMEAAVELVYTSLMPQRLRNLTDGEFDRYKDSFRKQLLQPPTGFSEEFAHFWLPIANGGRCFDLQKEMLDFMDQRLTSKRPLEKAWEELAMPRDVQRRMKVSVKYFAGEVLPRPDMGQASNIWTSAGLDMRTAELLSVEYSETQVFDAANSTARKLVAQEGGYFPMTFHCKQQPSFDEDNIKDAATVRVQSTVTETSLVQKRQDSALPGKVGQGRRWGGRQFLQPER